MVEICGTTHVHTVTETSHSTRTSFSLTLSGLLALISFRTLSFYLSLSSGAEQTHVSRTPTRRAIVDRRLPTPPPRLRLRLNCPAATKTTRTEQTYTHTCIHTRAQYNDTKARARTHTRKRKHTSASTHRHTTLTLERTRAQNGNIPTSNRNDPQQGWCAYVTACTQRRHRRAAK